MAKEFFGFEFFSMYLSILSFPKFSHNLTLTLLWWASWTMLEPLQLKRELRGNEILEGIVTPLNRAPIISKWFEKQFGSAVIEADVTQLIFQTPQRPLTSKTLLLYSNWWPEFYHLNLNSWIKFWCLLNAHLMSKGTLSFTSIICTFGWRTDLEEDLEGIRLLQGWGEEAS